MSVKTQNFYGHFISPPFFADQLFGDLTPSSKDCLKSICRQKCFRKNDTVFAAGDLPECIYILNSGQARLTVNNGINNVTDLRLVKPDEVLGINEVLANSFCHINVETVTPCVFECFCRDDFLRLLNNEPEICYRLLTSLGADLQRNYRRFSESRF